MISNGSAYGDPTLKERLGLEKAVDEKLRLRLAKILPSSIDNYLVVNFDRILVESARQITRVEGIDYDSLSIMDRVYMTKFRCPICGILPFYLLDLQHLNKVRCGKCYMIVALKNSSGKYGKIRKKIAIAACRNIDEVLSTGSPT
jgi:ribosomal protein S27AE